MHVTLLCRGSCDFTNKGELEVPVRVCSTHDSYSQYPWGYVVPVTHIPQYPWGHAVPVRICSTRESYPQYPWGYAVPVRICSTHEESFIHFHSYKFTHGYCISSRVLRIWLTGTDDMTHGYCISSRVLRIWLTGTEDMTHGYWGYDSRVLHILTGTEDMTHG